MADREVDQAFGSSPESRLNGASRLLLSFGDMLEYEKAFGISVMKPEVHRAVDSLLRANADLYNAAVMVVFQDAEPRGHTVEDFADLAQELVDLSRTSE
jgi:hypothetical protein